MTKSIDSLILDFSKILANRVNLSILDDIRVKCYGNKYSVKQVSVVSIEDNSTLILKPFDKKNISIIYKSLLNVDIGFSVFVVKNFIKVVFPSLTEERRVFLVKKVKKKGEASKVIIRNIRRNANQKIKLFVKEKSMSLDIEKEYLEKIQDFTSSCIKKINGFIIKKEKELLSV